MRFPDFWSFSWELWGPTREVESIGESVIDMGVSDLLFTDIFPQNCSLHLCTG